MSTSVIQTNQGFDNPILPQLPQPVTYAEIERLKKEEFARVKRKLFADFRKIENLQKIQACLIVKSRLLSLASKNAPEGSPERKLHEQSDARKKAVLAWAKGKAPYDLEQQLIKDFETAGIDRTVSFKRTFEKALQQVRRGEITDEAVPRLSVILNNNILLDKHAALEVEVSSRIRTLMQNPDLRFKPVVLKEDDPPSLQKAKKGLNLLIGRKSLGHPLIPTKKDKILLLKVSDGLSFESFKRVAKKNAARLQAKTKPHQTGSAHTPVHTSAIEETAPLSFTKRAGSAGADFVINYFPGAAEALVNLADITAPLGAQAKSAGSALANVGRGIFHFYAHPRDGLIDYSPQIAIGGATAFGIKTLFAATALAVVHPLILLPVAGMSAAIASGFVRRYFYPRTLKRSLLSTVALDGIMGLATGGLIAEAPHILGALDNVVPKASADTVSTLPVKNAPVSGGHTTASAAGDSMLDSAMKNIDPAHPSGSDAVADANRMKFEKIMDNGKRLGSDPKTLASASNQKDYASVMKSALGFDAPSSALGPDGLTQTERMGTPATAPGGTPVTNVGAENASTATQAPVTPPPVNAGTNNLSNALSGKTSLTGSEGIDASSGPHGNAAANTTTTKAIGPQKTPASVENPAGPRHPGAANAVQNSQPSVPKVLKNQTPPGLYRLVAPLPK